MVPLLAVCHSYELWHMTPGWQRVEQSYCILLHPVALRCGKHEASMFMSCGTISLLAVLTGFYAGAHVACAAMCSVLCA